MMYLTLMVHVKISGIGNQYIQPVERKIIILFQFLSSKVFQSCFSILNIIIEAHVSALYLYISTSLDFL